MNAIAESEAIPAIDERGFVPYLSLVVPMYNEAEVISAFFEQSAGVLDGLQQQRQISDYEIICVNDGSTDNTLAHIVAHHGRNPRIKVLEFSRNFGKEAALTAGLAHTRGDVIIPIDADLEEPPLLIEAFLNRWREGYDIVYGARATRQFDSPLKQLTARLFYQVFNAISEYPIPSDAGDFRLMDRAVVDVINAMPERNRFMKGIFSWPGFRTIGIPFDRQTRGAGVTKFTPVKLLGLAFSGIVSFSVAPLRLFIYLGTTISILAFFYMLYIIIKTVIFGIDEPGYASIMSTLLLLGGIQILGIGIIGEYIGRIYVESKSRPIYIIRKRVGFEMQQKSSPVSEDS